jgi:ERCC4-type nuclease
VTFDEWYRLLEARGLNERRCGCFAAEAVARQLTSVADLLALDDEALRKIPNIGRKSVKLLREAFPDQ